jgi:hypothetical protein
VEIFEGLSKAGSDLGVGRSKEDLYPKFTRSPTVPIEDLVLIGVKQTD